MSLASLLFDLQVIDLEIDGLRARLDAIGAALGETDALRAAREAAAGAGLALAGRRAALADQEQDLAKLEKRIGDGNKKLYGGTIHSSRELTDLQLDVESLSRQKGRQEEVVLGLLDEVEAAETQHAARQAEAAQVEAAWQIDQERLQQEQGVLHVQLRQAEGRRAGQATLISKANLAVYDGLRPAKAGHAVARLQGPSCMGCGYVLASGEAQHARKEAALGLALCPNCGRILYSGH